MLLTALLGSPVSDCFLRRVCSALCNVKPARLFFLVGLSGLEPPTSRLSGGRSNRLSYKPISPALGFIPSAYLFLSQPFGLLFGGDKRDRTADLLLPRQALSQLSYTPVYPIFMGLRVPSKLNNVASILRTDKPDHRTYPNLLQTGYSP